MSLATDIAEVIAEEIGERFAVAFVTGRNRCAILGRPLTEVQEIDMASAMLSAFLGTPERIAAHLEIDAQLHTFGLDTRGEA